MTKHNWIAARNAYEVIHACDGLSDGTFVTEGAIDTRVLECRETDEPIENWCASCMGSVAVHELATQQTLAAAKAFGAIKENAK